MMRTSTEISKIIKKAIDNAQSKNILSNIDIPEIIIEKPKVESFGNWSSSISLSLSKQMKKPPMLISELIKDNIDKNEIIEKVEIVKPGFLNFYLKKEFKNKLIERIIKEKNNFGSNNLGQRKKIQVEFVSVNPTGPVHVGHARGAVVGSCLSNILEFCGFEVTKEYYINDAGTQIELFVRSILHHIYSSFNLEYDAPEKGYVGSHLENTANEIISLLKITANDSRLEDQESIFNLVRKSALDITINNIKKDLIDLGVNYDKWFYESSLFDTKTTDKAMEILKKNDLIYELDGATWFKSSKFHTEQDVVIKRSNDGGHTYFFTDLAYHLDKFLIRKFDKVINIFGADHHSHVDRLKSALSALEIDQNKLNILLIQIVHFKNQEKVEKFSKRSGNIYSIRDLLDTVGTDSIRFNFLNRSVDSQQEFDLELSVKESSENPVYYAQYAHARLCSILDSVDFDYLEGNLDLLDTEYEKKLIDDLDFFSEVVVNSFHKLQTQNLTKYAIDIAKDLQKFYENCRVLSDDLELSKARIKLVLSCKIVLNNLFELLNVKAPERM
ncbi:MAG: arginine--tRNA ligase [Dehalococcoidales bacterium]|nr:arginine--tRNA ligase [Dehalococcoidales bacterium]